MEMLQLLDWLITQLVECRTVNSDVPGSKPGGPASDIM